MSAARPIGLLRATRYLVAPDVSSSGSHSQNILCFERECVDRHVLGLGEPTT